MKSICCIWLVNEIERMIFKILFAYDNLHILVTFYFLKKNFTSRELGNAFNNLIC